MTNLKKMLVFHNSYAERRSARKTRTSRRSKKKKRRRRNSNFKRPLRPPLPPQLSLSLLPLMERVPLAKQRWNNPNQCSASIAPSPALAQLCPSRHPLLLLLQRLLQLLLQRQPRLVASKSLGLLLPVRPRPSSASSPRLPRHLLLRPPMPVKHNLQQSFHYLAQ